MTIKLACACVPLMCAALLPRGAAAQTDYYNIDAGRPVAIEDAFPVERYAFELQAAPVRLERRSGGIYRWAVEPELAYGALPRTQLEVGFPMVFADNALSGRQYGLAGVHASFLHNLNVETETLPALALAGEIALPVGGHASDGIVTSAKAILTRTFVFGRMHANARYTFGDAPQPNETEAAEPHARWMAGVAIDRTFPLRSMLIIAEVYASQPMASDAALEWNAGTGFRYQYSPRLAVDAGIGRTLAGHERDWHLTVGAAYAFAIRALMVRK
jgi:hypothetical protein